MIFLYFPIPQVKYLSSMVLGGYPFLRGWDFHINASWYLETHGKINLPWKLPISPMIEPTAFIGLTGWHKGTKEWRSFDLLSSDMCINLVNSGKIFHHQFNGGSLGTFMIHFYSVLAGPKVIRYICHHIILQSFHVRDIHTWNCLMTLVFKWNGYHNMYIYICMYKYVIT